jgi:hypothetical protein
VRAKVEHVFRVLKCQFGYRKVRYRGIAKNGAQGFALLALSNLYLVRVRSVKEGAWRSAIEPPTGQSRRQYSPSTRAEPLFRGSLRVALANLESMGTISWQNLITWSKSYWLQKLPRCQAPRVELRLTGAVHRRKYWID